MRVMTLAFIDCQELACAVKRRSLGHHESKLKRISFHSRIHRPRYDGGSKKGRQRSSGNGKQPATLESKSSVREHGFMKKTRGRSIHIHQFFMRFAFYQILQKAKPRYLCVCSFQLPSVEMRDANIAKCFISLRSHSSHNLVRDEMPIRINYLDPVRSTMGGRCIATRRFAID